MSPAGLDHADLWVREKVDRSLKQIGRRDEIGVENANEVAGGRFQPSGERARLEPGAIGPVDQLNVIAALAQFSGAGRRDFPGIIGRIIQHLDLKQFLGIVELAHRAKQPLDYIELIENRQLNRDFRQLTELPGRNGGPFAVLEKEINDEVPVHSISGQTNEYREVTGRPNHITQASLHKVSCQY